MKGFVAALLPATLSGSSAALLLLLFKNKLVKRFGGAWYYYLWLPVLVLFLVGARPEIPVFSPVHSEITRPAAKVAADDAGQVMPETEAPPNAGAAPGIARQARIPVPRIEEFLFLIWLAGFLGSLLRYFISYFRFLRRTLNREAAFCAQGMEVYITARVVSPVLVGFFRPRLVLPDIPLDGPELSFILRHEQIHRRRRDIWYKFAAVLACSAHWFNPLAYLMVNTIGEACEYSCDQAVIKGMEPPERQQYSETILNVASHSAPALALGFSKSGKQLKRRFLLMFQSQQTKHRTLATILAAALFAGIFSVSSFVSAEDTTLNDSNGGIHTYYNTASDLERNLDQTLGRNRASNAISVTVVSPHYIDGDGKKVTYFNRTEPVFKVIPGWVEKGSDLGAAPVKTLQAGGKTITVAFPGDTAKYCDDPVINKMVQTQMDFEFVYQDAEYDHQAFISALANQGVYVFKKIIPAGEFEPESESPTGSGGTIGLRVLTKYDQKAKLYDVWNGRAKVNVNLDGNQGVQLGNDFTLGQGQTVAVDIKELTDAMPTMNVAIWDADTAATVDWIPNLSSGHRFYFTPGVNEAGHRFRIIVSTGENTGDYADINVFVY